MTREPKSCDKEHFLSSAKGKKWHDFLPRSVLISSHLICPPKKSPETSLTQGSSSLQPLPVPPTLYHMWGQFASRYCQWHLADVPCLLMSFGGDPWNLVSCLAHVTLGSLSLCFNVWRLMLISNHRMSLF